MDAHPFVPGTFFDSRDICHQWNPDVGYCRRKRADHAGESPLNDGPVRSTVERQQERIQELESEAAWLRERIRVKGDEIVRLQRGLNNRVHQLEAENSQLHFNLWMAKLDLGRAKIRQAIADVADADREDEMERVKAERDMARDQLSNLDVLAREVEYRVEKLTAALDK